jgi:hypothetical protein
VVKDQITILGDNFSLSIDKLKFVLHGRERSDLIDLRGERFNDGGVDFNLIVNDPKSLQVATHRLRTCD